MSTLKHKGKGPQSLTANLLRGGESVWLTPDFEWTPIFSEALLTEDPAVIEIMDETGQRDEESNLIVGVYFIDVDPDTGLPARYRERFRVNGPSYDTAEEIEKLSLQKGA